VPSNSEDISPYVVSVEGERVAMNIIGSAHAGQSAGSGSGGLVSGASCRGRGWGEPKFGEELSSPFDREDTAPIVEDLAAEESASQKFVQDVEVTAEVSKWGVNVAEHVSDKIVGSGWGGLVSGASCRGKGWGSPKLGEELSNLDNSQGSVMPLYLDWNLFWCIQLLQLIFMEFVLFLSFILA